MKVLKPYLHFCIVFFVMFLGAPVIHAQNKSGYDSSYITKYPGKITARIYSSRKYTGIEFAAMQGGNDFSYKPNTPLTLGLGATYQNLSLNLSYGFDFLNNKNDDKGKTKSIDLQVHAYPKNWAVDLLGMHHKGLYTDPKGFGGAGAGSYYYRPDASFLLAGIGAYRVVNGEKFSYNAAMIQSEWQKKSAGSLLYGGEVYYSSLKDDSSLVPFQAAGNFKQYGVNKLSFIAAGAGVGYAYTLVIQEHFYLMGSAIGNIDINFSKEAYSRSTNKKTSVSPSLIYKAAIGFNSDTWNLSANWAANALWVRAASSSDPYFIPTGNYRIMLAKRFGIAGKKIK